MICLLRTFTSMLSPKAQHSNPQAHFEASGAARTTAAMGTVQGPARRPPPRSTSLDAQAVSALTLVKISPTSSNTAPTSWDASPPTKMLGGFGMSHFHLQWLSKGRRVPQRLHSNQEREKANVRLILECVENPRGSGCVEWKRPPPRECEVSG